MTFDGVAQQYLALSVSLGERDPDSLDFYFGPDSLIGNLHNDPLPIDQVRQQAIALRSQLAPLHAQDPARADYLAAQLDALTLRSQLAKGAHATFDQESQTFFGIVAPPDSAADARTRIRAQIAALIPRNGTPAHSYSAFDSRLIVPPQKVPDLMQAALRECRAATLQHIQLPPGEHVDVEYVGNKPWSAFSRYLGNAHSRISVNMDFPHTVDRILDLACHEGYPGHHVFNTLRDQSLVQAAHRPEFYTQLTFSPQSYVSEAAASYAPDVVFPGSERLRIERDVLFPLAGLNPREAERYLEVTRLVASLWTAQPSIAREYLDERLEFVRAADALEHESLMEHGEGMLLYLNEYRSYMLAYTIGRERIGAIIEQGSPAPQQRWQRYRELMTHPVTMLPINP